MLEIEHVLFLVPWPAIVPKFDRTGDQHLKMAPTERRERCPLCDALEPRQDNGASAKRAKNRRLDDQAEMERIKSQNAHLQAHKSELEARFAALANEYNKLQQHRNLVLSLGANPQRNLKRLISKEAASIKLKFGCFMLQNGIPKWVRGTDTLQPPPPDHPCASEWQVAIKASGLQNLYHRVASCWKTNTIRRGHLDLIGVPRVCSHTPYHPIILVSYSVFVFSMLTMLRYCMFL